MGSGVTESELLGGVTRQRWVVYHSFIGRRTMIPKLNFDFQMFNKMNRVCFSLAEAQRRRDFENLSVILCAAFVALFVTFVAEEYAV